ncbi:MAG: hypothetical protein ABJG78_12380 [Cyclobacteriaceae bacterium]
MSSKKGIAILLGILGAIVGTVVYFDRRIRKVVVMWTTPLKLESAINTITSYEGYGIYCLTLGKDKTDEVLYIGKATFSFRERLMDHKRKWLHEYDENIYVRFGEFVKPSNPSDMTILDTESGLIYEHNPIKNKSQTKSYPN